MIKCSMQCRMSRLFRYDQAYYWVLFHVLRRTRGSTPRFVSFRSCVRASGRGEAKLCVGGHAGSGRGWAGGNHELCFQFWVGWNFFAYIYIYIYTHITYIYIHSYEYEHVHMHIYKCHVWPGSNTNLVSWMEVIRVYIQFKYKFISRSPWDLVGMIFRHRYFFVRR